MVCRPKTFAKEILWFAVSHWMPSCFLRALCILIAQPFSDYTLGREQKIGMLPLQSKTRAKMIPGTRSNMMTYICLRCWCCKQALFYDHTQSAKVDQKVHGSMGVMLGIYWLWLCVKFLSPSSLRCYTYSSALFHIVASAWGLCRFVVVSYPRARTSMIPVVFLCMVCCYFSR